MKDNDHRFSDDMTLWPRIGYVLFCYFINCPETYTQEQLLSWKQLEAYNYFESGFVRTVLAMEFGQGDQKCCMLKAKVNPSQRTADQAHEAWIIALQLKHACPFHFLQFQSPVFFVPLSSGELSKFLCHRILVILEGES